MKTAIVFIYLYISSKEFFGVIGVLVFPLFMLRGFYDSFILCKIRCVYLFHKQKSDSYLFQNI